MAEKDITEKLLVDHNDVFADIVNVLILGDNDRIREDELETTRTVSQYKAANVIHGEDRDASKFWTRENVRISLLGFENQTVYDVDEVFHVIGYDGAAYRDELNSDHGRYPVITLVLYFGTDRRWGKNRQSLHQIFKDLPPYLKPYVNDYKINVFEIAWLTDEQVAKFQSDFRIVADYFVQMRKNKTYTPSQEKMKHVNEVLDFMKAMSYDTAFVKVQNETRKGECETMSMADWFDQQLEEERRKTEETMADWFDKQLKEERRKTEETMADWFDKQLEEERRKTEETMAVQFDQKLEEERRKTEETMAVQFDQKLEEERRKTEETMAVQFDQKSARVLITTVDSLAENTGWSTEEACAKLNSSLEEYEKAKKLLADAAVPDSAS